MDCNDLFYLLFLKINIINDTYKAYVQIAKEEETASTTLDNIVNLLDKEEEFIYFDKTVPKAIYDITNMIRENDKSKEVCDKANCIIRKVNRLVADNYEENRIKFYEDEWYLRMGQKHYFDEEVCDAKKEDFKKLFNHDFKFMMELAVPGSIYISNDIFNYLSSISCFAARYNDVFDDEVIENILIISSSIDTAIKVYKSRKQITDYEYSVGKKVIKSINNNFKDYYDRNKSKKKELKKLVCKVSKDNT